MTGVSQKVLTHQLRDMERNQLIRRVSHPEIPPRVDYSLTEKGRSLEPVLKSMGEWGRNNGYQQPMRDTND